MLYKILHSYVGGDLQPPLLATYDSIVVAPFTLPPRVQREVPMVFRTPYTSLFCKRRVVVPTTCILVSLCLLSQIPNVMVTNVNVHGSTGA